MSAAGAAGTAGAAALLIPRGTWGLNGLEQIDGAVDVRLQAAPATADLLGNGKPDVRVWAYNGQVPGPEIRARQGDRLRVMIENGLREETTIHWHGVRV
nr:multicopper oxidase domain-containing protein [Sphingomonas sp.]